MVTKVGSNLQAPDGSQYVTLTDGAGNVGATITATATDNITQLGGNTINLGTGTTGTGTARVVIATDQPQLTNALLIANTNDYPNGAVPITASATGTTAATAATLAGAASKTTYIAGFNIGASATAAVAGAATVAGTKTGTLNYNQGVGAATAPVQLSQSFYPPIPASATNTGIVVTSAAAGTAGVTAVSAWGYQL